MLYGCGDVGPNYGWELSLFHKIRNFKDGVSFFEFIITFDKYKCDHNPKFEILWLMFNFKILEFTIYNNWHIEHPNSPYYKTDSEETRQCYDDGPNYERDNHD